MKLYKARPETVEVVVYPYGVRVRHADGRIEWMMHGVFHARYEPVLDLRV